MTWEDKIFHKYFDEPIKNLDLNFIVNFMLDNSKKKDEYSQMRGDHEQYHGGFGRPGNKNCTTMILLLSCIHKIDHFIYVLFYFTLSFAFFIGI